MYAFLQYRVHEFMTRDPVIVAPTDSLATLAGLFDRHGFNGAPVAGVDGTLRGLATRYDLLRAFRFTTDRMVPSYADIMRGPVNAVMTLDPITVAPEAPLTRVLELLVAARHKSFPVVTDGRLSGIIAREGIMRALDRARDDGGNAGGAS